MKVGIKTLKSLRDGQVLIEVGSADETNLLSANINDMWGGARSQRPNIKKNEIDHT